MSKKSRDVVYIQYSSSLPFISFGSKLAWNVGKAWLIDRGDIANYFTQDIENSNIACVSKEKALSLVEFIQRIGIVEIEWNDAHFFYSAKEEYFKGWIK
jgi:hypothetical protein